ncbi:DUF4167 domain-containing protein [Nitratireductor sp. GISD-1A_MAKvit]|uniref:DUF4167 domain-containing protein n=1 Tax=Nitratireductor sp. GISD-1A_MAKvit TaxID=3234198 RepID=UPI003467CE8A
MRPQQQNRRMRGRGNNNRKGPNPLARSYESNGPDVKIRGTAQQVADKYATLARDAQSSGDRVMAENYLQHAEHYNRIIAAAQAQQQQQQARENRDDNDGDADEQDASEAGNGNNQKPQRQKRVEDGSGPQPEIKGVPAEIALNGDDTESKSANGRATEGLNGSEEGEKPKPARRGRKPAAAKAENGDEATEGEKPAVKRPRRTRARKTDDAEGGESGEAAASSAPTDEVAAQG